MPLFNYRILTSFLLLTIPGCSSQESIQTNPFPNKNVPEHIFNINVNALKDTIIKAFRIGNEQEDNKYLRDIFWYYTDKEKKYKMPIFFTAETNIDIVFSRSYFSKPNTSSDVFLEVFHEAWISEFYYSHNHPLSYTTNFAIKLSKIGSNKTMVKVFALNPEVINGTGFGVHGPANIYTPAQPTTIEEYSLLLFIADKLGDTTLPPLKLPNNQ